MTKVYCENEIANRVYDSCINGVNTSINDDDSRQCRVLYIYLRTTQPVIPYIITERILISVLKNIHVHEKLLKSRLFLEGEGKRLKFESVGKPYFSYRLRDDDELFVRIKP